MPEPLAPSLPVARNAHRRHPERRAGTAYRDPYDWYVEEGWCTGLLLDALAAAGTPVTGRVLDPACGVGTVVEVLRGRGLDAVASDIVDRGCPGAAAGVDFTQPGAWPAGSADWVVTNPPYYGGDGSRAYVERGLEVARVGVAVLVPVGFLFSQARHDWWRAQPVERLLYLSQRCSMPPGALLLSGEVQRGGGKEDYLWAVFRHGALWPPVSDWLPPAVTERGRRKIMARSL